MKKIIPILVSLLCSYSGFAQCTINANAVPGLTLQCDPGNYIHKSAVAYHPGFNLYYSVEAGDFTFPLETFDGTTGAHLATVQSGFDSRGMWWNAGTNQLLANGYGSGGIYSQNLDGITGYALGTGNTVFSVAQPDDQSVGAFNHNDNEIVYYFSGQYYRYNATNMRSSAR